jgi:tetratricopeptide (TPR) repeat protein
MGKQDRDEPERDPLRRRIARWLGEERERRWRDLFLGLPFLLCVAAVVAAFVGSSLRSDREFRNRYRREATRALDAGNLATARLCFERLVREDAGDREAAYGLALVLARGGDAYGSIELLDRLAPLNDAAVPDASPAGFAPAHLALGRELLATTRPTAATIGAAERHLRLAVDAPPAPGWEAGTAEAHALLGRLYAAAARWELARAHLSAAVGRSGSDDLTLMLAQVCASLGRAEEAAGWAKRAALHWERAVDADPRNVRARVANAEALLLLEEFAAATGAIDRALITLPADPALSRAFGQACAAWIGALERRGSRDAGLAVDLLHRGLSRDPENPALLERLAALARSAAAASPDGARARALLNDLLADGRATATLHLILGADAYARGLRDSALYHYERAYALAPHNTAVANNLAFVLALGDPPRDEARALTLAESAVARDPGNLRFRDTRGQLYAHLGRWREAVSDLEAALPAIGDKRRAHAALAECYHQLGLTDLASAHRRHAGAGTQDAPTTATTASPLPTSGDVPRAEPSRTTSSRPDEREQNLSE